MMESFPTLGCKSLEIQGKLRKAARFKWQPRHGMLGGFASMPQKESV
jgi:hypothetical protein